MKMMENTKVRMTGRGILKKMTRAMTIIHLETNLTKMILGPKERRR